jgi:hypothetical protein
MTPTELKLIAIHKSVSVPLASISETYFNLAPKAAYQRAHTNELPVPTFRLSPSRKAPLMVNIKDLADHIDKTSDAARESWVKSQI